MADQNWTALREIFEEATQLAVDQRPAYLEQACRGDQTLLAEVRSLLASHDGAESFLEISASDLILGDVQPPIRRLEKGERLGHYEIIDVLGSGGMGEVYLAADQKLGRNVAIKILSSRFNRDESELKRFVREAKAASALNHPNILVIHEFGETEEASFIVSEFVDGNTLRAVMGDGHVPVAKVVQIAMQIANALAAAHDVDLVHRDIKPENIMVRRDGYVKVLDFGLAKLVERSEAGADEFVAAWSELPPDFTHGQTLANQTATGMILGTPNYMSPEQARGECIDNRTDIFSFGVVLYEMLSGRTPFLGATATDTIENLLDAEPASATSLAEGVPEELRRLVLKCLHKDTSHRYQSMTDVVSDLGSVANSPQFKRGTSHEDAYWLYLQGKNLIATHSPTDALAAIEYFDKAIALDDGFARAYAGRAQALFIASHGGGGSHTEMNESAKRAANQAIELDPSLGEAHAVFGEIAFMHDWDLVDAEYHLRRAVELEPTSELGHAIYGEFLATRKRFDEAVSEIKTAMEIEPKSCANQVIYGRILYFARRYAEAIVQFERVIEVFPSWTTAYGWIWLSYEMMQEYEKAFDWLIKNNQRNNVPAERVEAYENAYREKGWDGIAERLLQFENPGSNAGNFYALARHAIRVGDHDLALEFLERSYDAHQYQVTWLDVDPFFDPVRTAPLFTKLLKQACLT